MSDGAMGGRGLQAALLAVGVLILGALIALIGLTLRRPAPATAVLSTEMARPAPSASPMIGGTPSASTAPSPSPSPSPTPRSFDEVFREVRSGVLKVETLTCGSASGGSAFLVSRSLAVTAWHVVDEARILAVRSGDRVVGARVLAADQANDVALIGLDEDLADAFVFDLADEVRPGQDVAVLGYPVEHILNAPINVSAGVVTGTGRTDRGVAGGVIQIDAASNGGNSGGPVVDAFGAVVGVLRGGYPADFRQGFNFAVGVDVLAPSIERMRTTSLPAPPVCDEGLGGEPTFVSRIPTGNDVDEISEVLDAYFMGIDLKAPALSYSRLTPAKRDGLSVEKFWQAIDTSTDDYVIIHSLASPSAGVREALVTFRSWQDAEDAPAGSGGATCVDWELHYRFEEVGDRWLIASATPVTAPGWLACDLGDGPVD